MQGRYAADQGHKLLDYQCDIIEQATYCIQEFDDAYL
jgi:hypothetical protein